MRFLPDGSVLVAEKSGLIKKFAEPDGDDAHGRRRPARQGPQLLGPRAPGPRDRSQLRRRTTTSTCSTPTTPRSAVTPPRWGPGDGTSDPCPSPPGCHDRRLRHQRPPLATRSRSGSDWTASEQVLIEDWCQQFPSHSVGLARVRRRRDALRQRRRRRELQQRGLGPVRRDLGLRPDSEEPVRRPARAGRQAIRPSRPARAARSAARAPVGRAGEPRVLNGSILRAGSRPRRGGAGQPALRSGDANERRIIGYGFRNPFRMIVKPGTNDVWIADVGWNDLGGDRSRSRTSRPRATSGGRASRATPPSTRA